MSEITNVTTPAFLALADGTVLRGSTAGADGYAVGEVVFNTAMTGYQEILTDPSYAQQLVTLTYPHIGNVGTNDLDSEAVRPFAAGLVIRDASPCASNWRSTQDLGGYLRAHGVVAIAEVDTRRITRLLRDRGAQNGCIAAGAGANVDVALAKAREFPGLNGMDLAKRVSTTTPYPWREGSWQLDGNRHRQPDANPRWRVAAFDYGVKRNILRLLVDRGCDVHVLPAQASAADAFALKPDGVFLSNGPGDPAPCDYAIAAIREFLAAGTPLFGICLGHQLLGLACGARTVKMKFGHHGANHPVQDLRSGRVYITSQNHSFAVDEASLPATLTATHRSLFDGSLQGLAHARAPAFSFQGHPEASPGPHGIDYLFDHFIELMRRHRSA
ncbi:MAG: glutamine-hydrolyzing carbamoyl-phosphate synthase small subunit [Gammaproteobacteria bacterium]|nr:glutamine-hydrolyzing carbamoyl-phosphate synthase small subunit [Gammaproteobacteria bacterium]